MLQLLLLLHPGPAELLCYVYLPGGERAGLRRRRARVQITGSTLLGNSLRQTVHTHRASVHQAAKLVAAPLRVARVTAGLAESNGSTTGFMTHITCRLTAKNRDQLRNPTLGNRVWATFTFFSLVNLKYYEYIREESHRHRSSKLY